MLRWIDGQAFAHFTEWECRTAGYWDGRGCRHDRPADSAALLASPDFEWAMQMLALLWPVSCAVHLTNAGTNRRAWLGQASCFLELGNCAACTVAAWGTLTPHQQLTANYYANELITQWLRANTEVGRCRPRNAQLELMF